MSANLDLKLERQQNSVADEVGAYIAIVRPILNGILLGLKRELVQQAGGYKNITLEMMSRLYVPGDGDVGICFEYAVHDAVINKNPQVLDRIETALKKYCKVKGSEVSSILFGAEKGGAIDFIETAAGIITPESTLLSGSRGRPAKLLKHIDQLVNALRKESVRSELPYSISGLWKADLFLGRTDTDYWLGTTVKTYEQTLEPAKGLRIGIIPSREGQTDAVRRDEKKNLVICPLPNDGAFIEIFYRCWGAVRSVMHAKAKMPSQAHFSSQPERYLAKQLVERSKHPVVDIIAALEPQAQPNLLHGDNRSVARIERKSGDRKLNSIIVPVARPIRLRTRRPIKIIRR